MLGEHSLDAIVRARLLQWPQRPPGMPAGREPDAWLRGRPGDPSLSGHPFLKLPGSNRLRTLPDGLWLHFAGTPAEPFCDIFAIEACGSMSNLLEKRARFAPSTQSMLAICPVPWLLAPATAADPTPRWCLTGGLLRVAPALPLALPVRDIRVLYGLKQRHYEGFQDCSMPHPHEYFVPMSALTAAKGDQHPAMRALVARTAANANFLDDTIGFLDAPDPAPDEEPSPDARRPPSAPLPPPPPFHYRAGGKSGPRAGGRVGGAPIVRASWSGPIDQAQSQPLVGPASARVT